MDAQAKHIYRRMMTMGCMAALALSLCLPAMADDDDHDAVRDAVNSGRALSLAQLKRVVSERLPGEIVSVKVERENARLVYEFRILTANGHLVEAEVDAADGRILEIENE